MARMSAEDNVDGKKSLLRVRLLANIARTSVFDDINNQEDELISLYSQRINNIICLDFE